MRQVLDDVCELIVDCEHRTAPPVDGAAYPLIRTPDIGVGRLLLDKAQRITETSYKAWTKRAVPRTGDLILAREAPVGNVGIVPPGIYPVLGQRTVLIRPDPEKVDAFYLNYLLSGPDLRGWMDGVSVGATVPHLNMSDIRSMELPPLPSLSTQRKVGAILSAYDDLIENSNRRIKLLEEMAQRIYREWFVDLRYPGHEGVPLVDSELGPIPQGWKVLPLADVLNFHVGGGWGKDEEDALHTEVAHVIRGTDLARTAHLDISSCPSRFHTRSNLKSRLLQAGDLVLEVSGGSTDQPVGRGMLFSSQHASAFDGDVICASFCKLLRVKRDALIPELLFLHFWELYETRQIETYQVQSTGIKNLRFAQLLEGDLLAIPPDGLQSRIGSLVAPMLEQSRSVGGINGLLRRTRDLLLPLLISGAVDVDDLDIEGPDAA